MNTQHNLGIWISNQTDLSKISDIISHIPNVEDVFVISDNEDLSTANYAVISPFYITFTDITIAFVSVKDYLTNKDTLRSRNIFLFCRAAEILENNLDKKTLNNIKVIEL